MEGNILSRKITSVKKIEYVKDYKKLKLQEEFLEKNLASTIKGLKIDTDLIRQIDEDRFKAASTQRQSSIEEVIDVVKELKWLKSILQQGDPSMIRNLDVADCGSRLTRLSNKIEDLKKEKSQNLETLNLEGEALDSDLKEFERTIFTGRVIKPFPKNTIEPKCPTRFEVNNEFTELVARTGHTQGWSNEDHSLFVKTRKKCDSVPQLVAEMKKKRPHLTSEEVVNHEAWQKVYDQLRDKRRKEIAEWRSRNNKKTVDTCNTENRDEELKRNMNNERGKKEEKIEKENINKKKLMIEKWRDERARKSAMDEEQKKRLEKCKLEEEKRKRETRRFASQIKLTSYKLERTTSPSKEIRRPIFHKNHGNSVRLMKSFREQDEKFLRKRLSLLKVSDKNDEKRKSAKREESRVHEYSTLLKPTKVWKEKCRPDLKTDNFFDRVNYIKNIQRLSTPHGDNS